MVALLTVYLFISDVAEHEELAEAFGGFTDARPSRPPLSSRQIVVVSFNGETIGAVGRMNHSSRKAANYKWHVRLDDWCFLMSRCRSQSSLNRPRLRPVRLWQLDAARQEVS
jgi:hypothetical protein